MFNISKSILYDSLKEELTARCHSLEVAMAMLIFADKVMKNVITPEEVLRGDRFKSYISTSVKDAQDNYRILQTLKDDYERESLLLLK